MINDGIFKETFEIAVARRYERYFKSKKDNDRVSLIKTVIMNKSPSVTQKWYLFQHNDQRSFNEFYNDIKIIKEFASDVDTLRAFNNSLSSWVRTWQIMKTNLDSLSQTSQRINQKIYKKADGELIKTICDWYLDKKDEHQLLIDKVYNIELRRDMIKIIIQEWNKVKGFER